MFRCYISDEQFDGENVRIEGPDVNHIVNVMRLKKGDWVTACNGSGTDYVGQIEAYDKEYVLVKVGKTVENESELLKNICLFQGIPKGEKMDYIIQKCVEVGVKEIVPVEMTRCVVKLNDAKKIHKKTERWNKISEAAAKQSGRGVIPVVSEPVSFKAAIEMAKKFDKNLIPYELFSEVDRSKEIFMDTKNDKSVGIFIGPEGGITEEEVAYARENGVIPVSLGKRILRTETAGLVTISILAFVE